MKAKMKEIGSKEHFLNVVSCMLKKIFSKKGNVFDSRLSNA
jgi:hypothetical protein